MAKTNAELLTSAKDAVRAYHGDTSVSMQTTLDGLRGIREDISAMIDACERDLADSEEE